MSTYAVDAAFVVVERYEVAFGLVHEQSVFVVEAVQHDTLKHAALVLELVVEQERILRLALNASLRVQLRSQFATRS